MLDSLMKEDICYSIIGHVCTYPRSLGRVVSHPASMVIAKRATVTPLADRNIPSFYYDFATLDMLERRLKDKNAILTDYLGRIETAIGVHKKKDINMLKITLLDQSNSIVLILWGKIAFSFKEENAIGKLLAVSSAKVTAYQGRLQLESTDITTLHVNPPLDNLQEIVDSYKDIQARQSSYSALQLTQVCGELGLTITELKMKQPEQFKNQRYTCEAKIKEFEAYRGWFSVKCPDTSCTKTLHQEKGRFVCEDGHPFQTPNYMYCVNAIIMDDTSTLPMVFFNDVMQDFLGISCTDMVTRGVLMTQSPFQNQCCHNC